MAVVKKRSVAPIYLAAVVWLIWGIWGRFSVTWLILVALLSAAAYFVGKLIWPDRTWTTPEPEQKEAPKTEKKETAQEPSAAQPKQETGKKPQSTGDAQLDALVTERDRALSEMRRLNDSIEDETISRQIDHLEDVTRKIIDQVVAQPTKLPQIRRFMSYYLPTTLKLLNAYDRMDAVGVSGANIDGTKGKIEDMMQTICTAFDRQLDALFGDEALDISTDIAVMEQMLAREGIGGMNIQQESNGHK